MIPKRFPRGNNSQVVDIPADNNAFTPGSKKIKRIKCIPRKGTRLRDVSSEPYSNIEDVSRAGFRSIPDPKTDRSVTHVKTQNIKGP